jgi:hypothetical protein
MMKRRFAFAIVVVLALARPAGAKQRPLVTQDPETIGAGRVLIEAGIDGALDEFYPLSGLQGNVRRVPMVGIDVGLSSTANLQITGGPYDRLSITGRQPAPLAGLVTATGDTTHDRTSDPIVSVG